MQNHPALQTFLQNNSGVRDQLRQDPNAFLRDENRFDRAEDRRDRDFTRADREQFDRFLDSHREIAEQVRKNPSLVNNREFVQEHPALQSYLESNPGVRDQVRQDPHGFTSQENRFGATENGRVRDEGHERMASFGEFMKGHSTIAQDVSKNPSLVRNEQYVENHRELNEYLNAHPDVRTDWASNPQGFVKGAQQSNTAASATAPNTPSHTTNGSYSTGSPAGNTNPTPTHEPKPKQ